MSNHRRTRRPSRRPHRPNNNSRLAKIAALIAIPLVTTIGGGFALLHFLDTEQIDDQFCYAREDQVEIAILADASFTAGSSAQQRRDFETAFLRAFEDAPANARISIFSTGREVVQSLAEPVFSMCKPAATQAEQDALEAPSKPAPYLARQAEEAGGVYRSAVEGILRDLQDASLSATDSPLLEQLQAISRHTGFSGRNRVLWVLTDGRQNSDIARACMVPGDLVRFEVFATQQRYEYVRPDSFEGTEVEFLLVENGVLPQPGLEYCTNDEIRAWWPDYFRGNGADNVRLTRLMY